MMPSTSSEANVDRHELVCIPAGWFMMGCDAIEGSLSQDNERPVHRVWVDEFLLATHQVTNADYAHFVTATRSIAPPFWNNSALNQPDQPVVGVSWHDAVRYCAWLTSANRKSFRLPTEAEWERSARGGCEGKLFPWGDEPPQSLPNYSTRWLEGTEIVGGGKPNAYGLYNMCENVHEWCGDWYAADYYDVSPERNPQGPESGERRSSRGGSWRHHIKASRCAARSSIPPDFRYADYGFRVAAQK